MSSNPNNFTIEGFVADQAFVDRSKNINPVLIPGTNQVSTLTPKVLSYFNTVSIFTDRRAANTRVTNWVASTQPQLVIDDTVFTAFTTAMNNVANTIPPGFFELIDFLLFNYSATRTTQQIETALLNDTDIATIYTPGSFRISSNILTDTVYLSNNTPVTISVPAFVSFSITLPVGQTTSTFSLKLYASVDAFLQTYNQSTIVKAIPPLPFQTLYNGSLIGSIDNVFSTASLTTTLNYSTIQATLGSVSVSGVVEYQVVLTDGTNNVRIPFNLLYKGRAPTVYQIRQALKSLVLNSGVGTEAGWRARIPGIFVDGRFYLIPLWDQTYTKPDQVLYPDILPYPDYKTLSNQILDSLGFGDVSSYMDCLSAYYNHIQLTAVPDLTGQVSVTRLSDFIPDYQNHSVTSEQFNYMLPQTQNFAKALNTILAVDSGAITSQIYTPITESQLTFYNFTVNNYEFCVITQQCYQTVKESTL